MSEPTPPETVVAICEDEELARRVIAAVIQPEPSLLKALYREGMSAKAVTAYAARIGLTGELVKNCRLTGVLPAIRVCVKCDARFLSAGSHNRLCKRCLAR